MDLKQQFAEMIASMVEETGSDLRETKEVLAEYAAERSERLAAILDSGEPGFEMALEAARDNLMLKAGLEIGDDAAAVDNRWRGLFAGGLRIAAAFLAAL